jgi:hypothetical protein
MLACPCINCINTAFTTLLCSQGPIKKFLFHWGFARKRFFLQSAFSQEGAAPFFDKLVFSKV